MIRLIFALIVGAVIALLSSNMSAASEESQFLDIDRDGQVSNAEFQSPGL